VGTGAVLIVVLTMVVYIPAMRGGFIWDDALFITDNPMMKAHDGLHRFWLTTEAPDYYPLTWSLWWLEWRAWGSNATGYHVVNILLHAANAVLVWMILRRLKISGAWLAALAFAIHPVNVATVAWISEQKNTLSMMFSAVAVLLYLKFDESDRWPWYGLSLMAFLLALLSKSAAVMLPVVLLGCVWWMRHRIRWKDLLRCAPFFLLSLVLGLATVWFQYHQVLEEAITNRRVAVRLAAAGWAPWFYFGKTLVPLNLMLIYPKWHIDASRWICYVPGVLWIACFVVFWWKRESWGRPLLFGFGCFVAMLFPVLGFFDQGFYEYSAVADHWQYYSIIGIIALVVAAGEGICRRLGERRRWAEVLVGAAVFLTLGAATWKRTCVYATNETFWWDNVTRNPGASVAHFNLGEALAQKGEIKEAIDCYERALKLDPDYAQAHNNLGNSLFEVGRVEEAIAHLKEAVRLKPDSATMHSNLGGVLVQTGRTDEGIKQLEEAVRLKPDFADAQYNWGVALEQAGRNQEAIGHFQEALQIEPDYVEARNELARLQPSR